MVTKKCSIILGTCCWVTRARLQELSALHPGKRRSNRSTVVIGPLGRPMAPRPQPSGQASTAGVGSQCSRVSLPGQPNPVSIAATRPSRRGWASPRRTSLLRVQAGAAWPRPRSRNAIVLAGCGSSALSTTSTVGLSAARTWSASTGPTRLTAAPHAARYVTEHSDPYRLHSMELQYLIHDPSAFRRYLEGALTKDV